jgi:antitoxin HicB
MTKNLEILANQPFRTITYFEPEDNSWYAYHPELGQASCYAIGDTEEEARELLKEETKEFIELLLSEGKEIPKPQTAQDAEDLPSGQFITRIPRTLHKKLKERAEIEKVSLNHLVSVLLTQSLEKRNYEAVLQKAIETVQFNSQSLYGFPYKEYIQSFNLKIENQLNNSKPSALLFTAMVPGKVTESEFIWGDSNDWIIEEATDFKIDWREPRRFQKAT